MSKKTRVVILIYLLIMIGLAVVIYVIPSVTGMLTPTELIQYGELKETDRQVCYFVRDEKVYSAAASGTINYYFEDNTKIRRNTAMLSLEQNGVGSATESRFSQVITRLNGSAVTNAEYRSEFNGVVSYFVDGYEGYFTPQNIIDLRSDKVSELVIEEPINLTRNTAYAGEPLYKICDNQKWYATCFIEAGTLPKYQKGNTVTFELPLGSVEFTVTEIVEDGSMWQIVFESDRYYEDFTKLRMLELDIVTSDYSGLIVPNSSIATLDGQVGVYVKQKTEDYKFVPIKIRTSDGELSVVADSKYYDADGNEVLTVEIYDEILKDPEKRGDKDVD